MIMVITVKEKNKHSGREELIVSHGVDAYTGRVVILPCVPPDRIGAVFNSEMQEYILPPSGGPAPLDTK